MEISAILEKSKCSWQNLKVRFRNYVGDDDSKTYSGIVAAKPYGDHFLIYKKECVGHVQKRMGTRLRD